MEKKIAEKLIVNVNDIVVYPKMYHYMVNLLKQQEELENRKIIILCIGSDRYIGDALGPLVGSYLVEHTICTVYGSLEMPVHAGNLVKVIQNIKEQYHQPIIIAVDACLGKNDEIGNIEIWEGSLEAGIAVGNKLPCIGTISIIGVVNASGYLGYLDLQSTPLSIVMKLSKCIGKMLGDAVHSIQNQ
ncbi:spore protease YyaC [Pelosinus baikalensis]|uniref:Spore protease YyaC n=1 Tax=Pelosinus baikalensis TaxID=2892015 RepID=A0ABS8I078_9FIRM|nr:spore protease YyaC [Pelosinus baikalensis]MCC5467792.1 spore protease YyaC [Pelosinus baikalensis]